MPAAALALAGGIMLYSGQQASADEGSNPRDTMIQALVERFGLNQTEVETFFEEQHAARQAEREATHEANLDAAVTAGVITESQKDALVAKHAEMQVERETARENGEKPDKSEREEHRAEMEAWATEQGIDLEALHEFMQSQNPEGGRHGMRKMM